MDKHIKLNELPVNQGHECTQKIGFIGLGLMGFEMASHLLSSFNKIWVWNRNALKSNAIKMRGALICDTLKSLAKTVDIIFLCVTDEVAVESILFGNDGISGVRKNIIVVDHSTISPGSAKQFAKRAKKDGCYYIDAPVTGSVPGAKKGTLQVFIGGEADKVELIKPLLSSYSQKINYMGESGQGQATKLCNQIMLHSVLVATFETLNFAKSCGLDQEKIMQALSGTLIDSKAWTIFGENAIKSNPEMLAHIKDVLKDLNYIKKMASDHCAKLILVEKIRELFHQLVDNGFGFDDLNKIKELYLLECAGSNI